MTKITLETINGYFTVELSEDVVFLDDVMQDLVKPILLAAGYQPENINDYIPAN